MDVANRRRKGAPEIVVVLALLLAGILVTLPYSGPHVRWDPDGLFYEAQKRELQGEDAETARREVVASAIGAPIRQDESDLAEPLRRVDNPAWVDYSAQFYRRRWTVPVLAAALDPILGERSIEQVSLIGWALLPPLLYLLLRRRFAQGPSAAASVFCLTLPPLFYAGPAPGTDTWGLSLLVAGLLAALLVRDSGLRWLPAWIVLVVVLSFTRDLTVVLVIATAWLAFRERSRRLGVVAVSGAFASLPAPLIFAAPVRDNLAYVFDDYRIPADVSWSSIASQYPSQLIDLIAFDASYPGRSPFPTVLALAIAIVVVVAIAMLLLPQQRPDPFVSLIRAATVGGVLTILLSVNATSMRLELVFVPALATGLALLGEHLLSRLRPAPALEPRPVET